MAVWQSRQLGGLRDPLHPGRAFTPNEKYAAMVEAAGYLPVALTAEDYVELLPARWHAVNAYGIKVNRRTYDGEELNPFRQQPSGVKAHKNLWEVHCDPYDVSRIWVRDHWNGGWITVFWTQLTGSPPRSARWPGTTPARRQPGGHRGRARRRGRRPAPPRQRRAGRREPGRAGPPQPPGRGPHQGGAEAPRSRDRARPGDRNEAAGPADSQRTTTLAEVIPMPIFDPFAEADKPW